MKPIKPVQPTAPSNPSPPRKPPERKPKPKPLRDYDVEISEKGREKAKKTLALGIAFVLAGCGTAPSSLQGLAGPAGATGTAGADGVAGAQGPAGTTGASGPNYRLQDANGNLIPGILISELNNDSNGVNLWNEAEGTMTSYGRWTSSNTYGMIPGYILYSGSNCTGTGYAPSDLITTVSNASMVFSNHGLMWKVATASVNVVGTNSVYNDGEPCQAQVLGSTNMFPISLYTGQFPINPAGPYTLVE